MQVKDKVARLRLTQLLFYGAIFILILIAT